MTEQDEMLALIIQEQDKAALDDYADARGIKLDRRKAFDNMLADFQAELATDATSAAVDATEPAEAAPGNGYNIPQDVPLTAQDNLEETRENLEANPEDVENDDPVAPNEAKGDISLISAYASQWVNTVANDVLSVNAALDGTELTVAIITKHGATQRSTFLQGDSVADIEAAFADIARQIG